MSIAAVTTTSDNSKLSIKQTDPLTYENKDKTYLEISRFEVFILFKNNIRSFKKVKWYGIQEVKWFVNL